MKEVAAEAARAGERRAPGPRADRPRRSRAPAARRRAHGARTLVDASGRGAGRRAAGDPLRAALGRAAGRGLVRRRRRVRALGEGRARGRARARSGRISRRSSSQGLANAYILRLELEEAAPLVERAFELAEESGSIFGRATALGVRGWFRPRRRATGRGGGRLHGGARALRRGRQHDPRSGHDDDGRPLRRVRPGRRRAGREAAARRGAHAEGDRATAARSARRSARSRWCSSSSAGSTRPSGSRSRRARRSGPRIASRRRRRQLALGVVRAAQGRDEEAEASDARSASTGSSSTSCARSSTGRCATSPSSCARAAATTRRSAYEARRAALSPSSTAPIV